MDNALSFAPYQEIAVARVTGGEGETFSARLLTRVGGTLLIDRPRRRKRAGEWEYLEPIEVGDLLALALEHEGVRYEFKAPVVKVSFLPFFCLCLKFRPDGVRRTEIRSAPRYRGLVPVLLTARRKSGEPVLLSRRAYLVDVGLKGIGLVSENKVPRHFLLALEIAADCRLQLKCRVRNVKKEPVVRDFFYYGCEIEEVNQPDRFREYLDFLAAAAELFAAPGPPPADDGGSPAVSG